MKVSELISVDDSVGVFFPAGNPTVIETVDFLSLSLSLFSLSLSLSLVLCFFSAHKIKIWWTDSKNVFVVVFESERLLCAKFWMVFWGRWWGVVSATQCARGHHQVPEFWFLGRPPMKERTNTDEFAHLEAQFFPSTKDMPQIVCSQQFEGV